MPKNIFPIQRRKEMSSASLNFKGEPIIKSDAPNNVRAVPMTAPKSYIPWTENKELKKQESELTSKKTELLNMSRYFTRAEEISKRSPLLRQAQMKALNSSYGITDEASYNSFVEKYNKSYEDTERLMKKYNLAVDNEKTRYNLWLSSLRNPLDVKKELDDIDNALWSAENRRSVAGNTIVGKELDAEIASLQEKRKLLQQEQSDTSSHYYASIKNRPDFDKKSKWDGKLDSFNTKKDRVTMDNGRPIEAYATDEEVQIYNYLKNTEGVAAAKAYLEYMSDTWTRRKAGELVEATEKLPAVIEQASKTTQSLGAGVQRAGQGMYSAATGKTTNTTANQFAKQTYREKSNAIGKAIYDLSESIGNMAPGILLSAVTGNPTAGLVSIGVSSGGNAYNEARKNGASKADAYAYGTLVGTSEAILGKALGGISSLGGGKIGTAVAAKLNAAGKAFLAVAGKLAANGISEGVEEGLQTILEPIFATMVLDEKYKPAQFSDVAYSALLGFLSAGFLEGSNTTAEYFNSPLDQKVIDKYISDGEKAAENSLERAIADDIKSKLAANPDAPITGFDVGRIARYYKDTRKAEKTANKELKKTLIEAAENETTSPTPAEAPATPQPEEQFTEFDEATPIDTFSEYADKAPSDEQKTPVNEKKSDSFYISEDTDGNYFVDVTEDILDTSDGESVARTLQRVISEKFNNLISVNGQKFQINKTTNDEFRDSNSARTVLKTSQAAYEDKLRTIANADEIIKAAKNWINEELKHTRKDDIVSFGRGEILYRVGSNGYSADVLVGIRKNGAAVLYDLINITEKEIVEAPVTRANPMDSPRRQNTSTDINYTTHSPESQPPKSTTPAVSRDGIEIKPETDSEVQSRLANVKDELERTGILSGASDKTINTVRRLSKLLKTDIRFEVVPDIVGKDGKVFEQQGRYDHNDGIIYINMGSGTDTYTQIIAHEFTHSIEGTDLYIKLEKYARKFHDGKAGKGAYNSKAKEILERYQAAGKNYDIRKAQTEVVSNYVAEHLLNNEANIELLVKENRPLAEKLKDVVDKVLSVIGDAGTKKEVQTKAKLTRMSKLLNKALETRNAFPKFKKDIETRLSELRRDFNEGDISESEYNQKLDELDNEALSMGLDLQELMKGGESYSISKETAKSAITLDDVNTLRSIGRKSINKFTKEDIEKAEKWATRFYKDLGVKSPFFRAWFGEWRTEDISPVEPVSFEYGENPKLNFSAREIFCKELNAKIHVDDDIIDDSLHYAKINGDEKQTRKLLGKIDEIIIKGILLDTQISAKDSANKKGSTQFMHYLYTPVSINGAPFLAKVAIEEYDITGKKRAYNLRRIELSELSRAQYSQMLNENRGKYAYSSDALSVSQLYELVKTYDEDFVSAPKINKLLLNEDGTPKVFYHGTDKPFTEFKLSELRSREGSFFFAESREDAEGYGKYVHEVYLRGEKLADYDNQPREFYQLKDKKAQVEYLKQKGYEGWYSDMDSGGWGEVSVFSPEQIKSAKPQGDSMGNVGTFSKYESDIRYSITPEKTAEESIDKSTSDVPVVTRLPIQSLGKLRAVEKGLRKVIGDIYKIKYARVDELKPAIRKLTEKYLSEGKITADDIAEFTDFIKNTFDIDSTKEDTNRVKYQLNEAINEDLVHIRDFFKQYEKDANAQPEWVQESREERAKNFSNKKIRQFRNWVREEFSVPDSEKETLETLISGVVARIENGTVPKDVLDAFFGAVFNSAEVTEDSLKRDFPDVYKTLRHDKLTLTDSERSDLEGYGSYKEFREAARGYLNLGKDGTSVEDMYAFCQSFAPSLFPESIDNTNDQAVRLLEVSKMFTPQKSWAFEEMTQEEREKLYDEFTKQVLGLARDVTTAQKYAQGTTTVEQEMEVETNDVDVDELLEVMEKMKKERKKMLSVRGRTILSEKDEGALRAILDGHITIEQLSDDYNKKDIKAIYEASKEYTRLKNIIDEQRRQIHKRRYDMAKKYLADGDILTGFRDRNHGLLYMLNPMERNLRYVGKRSQLSEDLIDAYIKPIKRANRKAILYKNSIVQKIEDLKLSRKVKAGDQFSEAYAVQFVGEAENNIKYLTRLKDNRATKDGHTLEEWKTMLDNFWEVNPGIDRNKINNAVDVFREVYDDLFKKMNEARVRNGYEPISYRRGYFPHFSPKESNDILAQFGKALGINVEFSGLPTDINGLTQNFRPGMRYQAFANERLGFETVFDAVEGLHRYLDTATDVIFQTDNICNLRALTQQIRYQASDEGKRKREDFIRLRTDLDETERAAVLDRIHEGGKYTLSNFVNDLEEYTNLLAGKKSKWDRGVEALSHRDIYGLMKSISGKIAANMVAWNVGSWLTNLIPLVQGATGLDTKYMLVGMREAMRNVYKADGFESLSVWLTTRRGSEELLKNYELTNIPTTKIGKALDKEALHKIGRALDKSAEIGMIPMEAIDMFVSNTLVRGRYHQNMDKGMDSEAALEEADSWVAGIMADRSKGGLPTIFGATNPMVKLLTQFQVEVANQIGFFFSDLPMQLRDKEAKAIVLAIAKYVIGAYLYNELYELLTGRRPALDPLGIINDSIGDFSGKKFRDPVDAIVSLAKGENFLDKAYKMPLGEAMWEFTMELAEETPFVGGLLGGGRIPISSALPSVPNVIKSVGKDGAWGKVGKELLKPVTYSVLPGGGGQISKAVKGISAVAHGGKYGKDNKGREILQYPITPNPWTAIQSAVFGPTATKGGREWINSNFKSSLSYVETKAYKEAVYEGLTQDDAYDLVETVSSAGDKNSQKIAALNKAKVSQNVKRAVYEQMFLFESPNKVATLNALDKIGAYRDVVIDFMLEHPEVSSQEELMTILGDKLKAGRVVGSGSSFTKQEKAAILQTVLPNTKNNPYWPELKESVFYVVHPDVKLEDEEKKRKSQ